MYIFYNSSFLKDFIIPFCIREQIIEWVLYPDIEKGIDDMAPIIGISMSIQQEEKLFVNKEYTDAIFQAGGIPILLPYIPNIEFIEKIAFQCQGLLLTGGGDIDPNLFGEEPMLGLGEIAPLRDEMERHLIQFFLQQKKPIFGICRGMQLLNVELGGKLYQDLVTQKPPLLQHQQIAPRWHASHHIQIQEFSLLHQIIEQTTIKVNSYHHQAVYEIAPSLQTSAYAYDGVVEAIEATTHPFVLGVQWHPESMVQHHKEQLLLFQAFVHACKNIG